MLWERSYMNGAGYRPPRPLSVWLIFVLGGVFALQCIDDVYLSTPAERWLALTVEGVRHGFVWQLLSFQFLHGSVFHLLGNALGLWFFGRFVEEVVGRRRFLFAYFGSGVIGGLLQGLLMLVSPTHYGGAMYGASAGVSGMFAIFARLQAQSEVRWNFVLPIKASTLLWIYIAFELFFTLVPSGRGGNVAHAAHLGGILAGMLFVRLGWQHDYVKLPWEEWMQRLRSRAPSGSRPLRRQAAPRAVSDDAREPSHAQVDAILDKINEHGIHSLTARERQILEDARKRMGQR